MTPLLTLFLIFFFNDTATTEIYTLSLHDALPIYTSFVFFACALAIGIGFGVSVPAFQCLFVNVAPHHMRGTATSTYLTSFDFGMGIGMLSAGFIATHTNLATAYGVGAVCCLLSLFVYIRLVKASYERNKLIS